MIVTFFTGTVRDLKGESTHAVWANTPFGTMLYRLGDERPQTLDTVDMLSEQPVATCDLPGLDRAGMEILVFNILKRGYAERAGIRGKGDAVLFLLVNESIHSLDEIARKERL